MLKTNRVLCTFVLAIAYVVAVQVYFQWKATYYVCTSTAFENERYWTPVPNSETLSYEGHSTSRRNVSLTAEDFEQRMERQQIIVNRICRKQHMAIMPRTTANNLHVLNGANYRTLLSHLWYNDSSHTIYCSALARNSSSAWNNAFGHFLSLEELLAQVATEAPLTPTSIYASLYKRSDDLQYLEPRLSTYNLFASIPNPLVRLVDLYKTHVEHSPSSEHSFVKTEILRHSRRQEYMSWISSNKSYELKPTFSNFIQYFLSMKESKHHDDFVPFMEACQPCVMHYHFYVHQRFFVQGMESLQRAIGVPIDIESFSNHNELSRLPFEHHEYYRQLSMAVRNMLRSKLEYELELYYALSPEDRDMTGFI